MPYTIKMKDGTVIPGIPDDVPPEKARDQYYSDKAANEPKEGFMTTMAGMGSSAMNVARNIGQLAGMVSPEEAAEAERIDRPLLETASGTGGRILGDIATTALPGAMALRAGKIGAIAAGAPLRYGVTAGAAGGAATSTPETRTSSTVLGAAGGAAGSLLARAIARLGTKGISQSPEAAAYIRETGEQFMPAAQAAEKGSFTRAFYEDISPSLPGGKKGLEQSRALTGRARTRLHQGGLPATSAAELTGDLRTDMRVLKGAMDDAWKAWDDVTFTPGGATPTIKKLLVDGELPKNVKGIDKTALKVLADEMDEAGQVSGRTVMRLRNEIGAAATKPSGKFRKIRSEQLQNLKQKIDEEFLEQLAPWEATKFRILRDVTYPKYKALLRTAKRGPEPTFEQYAAATRRGPAGEAVIGAGEAPLQRSAELTAKTLGKEMDEPGFWRRLAALGAFRAIGAIGLPVTYTVNKMALPEVVQRAVTGQVKWQKALARAVEKDPQLAAQFQAILTAGGTVAGVREAQD